MTLLSALNWRYAVRQFNSNIIPKQDLDELTEAVRLTPTAYGLMPYRLILVESKRIREALLEHGMGQDKIRDCSHLAVLAIRTDIDEHYIDAFFALTEKQRGLDSGTLSGFKDHVIRHICGLSEEQRQHWADQQAHIALGNLLSAAALKRIDACPMAGFEKIGFDKVLNLSAQNMASSVICALGYRDEGDQSATAAKVRLANSEFLIKV